MQRKSILFVCLGNICRSPTGEAVMQHYLQQHGAEHDVHVDSAGTIGYHTGNPADSRMRTAGENAASLSAAEVARSPMKI